MINLLPPYYKKELKQKENQRLILILFFLSFIFLIYLILILLVIKFYIQGEINSIKSMTILEEKKEHNQELKNFKKKIDLSNQNIKKLKQFYKERESLNEMLEKIFKNIPKGIVLNSFSWDKQSRQVVILGTANTREDYLKLQDNLKSNNDFFDFSFPIDILAKKTNVDFNINFKIKK